MCCTGGNCNCTQHSFLAAIAKKNIHTLRLYWMKFIPLSLRKTFSCRVSIVIHDKNILCPWEYQWPLRTNRTYPSVILDPDLQNRMVIRAWRRREGSKCFPAMISQWPKETAAYCHEPWPSSLIFFVYFVYFRLFVLWICFLFLFVWPKEAAAY